MEVTMTTTQNEVDALVARIQQLCIIAENDGKNNVDYYPKPVDFAPQEFRTAITKLIERAALESRIDERNMVALDNYRGHTISADTDWNMKYDKFIQNNEKRLTTLKLQSNNEEVK